MTFIDERLHHLWRKHAQLGSRFTAWPWIPYGPAVVSDFYEIHLRGSQFTYELPRRNFVVYLSSPTSLAVREPHASANVRGMSFDRRNERAGDQQTRTHHLSCLDCSSHIKNIWPIISHRNDGR